MGRGHVMWAPCQSGDVAPRWLAAPGSWFCRACRRGWSLKNLTSGFQPSTARGEPCALLGAHPNPAPGALSSQSHRKPLCPPGKGEEGPARRGGQLLPRACKIHDKDNISIGNMSPAVSDLRPPAHLPPTPSPPVYGVTGQHMAAFGVRARHGPGLGEWRPQSLPGHPLGCLVWNLHWESWSMPCPDLGL